jgi:hypothetical protein
MRELTVDSVRWTIWDVASGGMTGQPLNEPMRGGWLSLQSSAEKRRIIPSPAGWEDWPDDLLADAVRGATPVPPRPLTQ